MTLPPDGLSPQDLKKFYAKERALRFRQRQLALASGTEIPSWAQIRRIVSLPGMGKKYIPRPRIPREPKQRKTISSRSRQDVVNKNTPGIVPVRQCPENFSLYRALLEHFRGEKVLAKALVRGTTNDFLLGTIGKMYGGLSSLPFISMKKENILGSLRSRSFILTGGPSSHPVFPSWWIQVIGIKSRSKILDLDE